MDGLGDVTNSGTPSVERAYSIVHRDGGRYALTDLTKTILEEVQSPFFRLFTPVKLERQRLPTSLPEFHEVRHTATLSDSPVTAAAALGGHWSEHNLAAITHVAACNFRCRYCYVDYRHLAGHDSLQASPKEIVIDFLRVRDRILPRRLSMLRVSGGEPFLAPGLIAKIYREMDLLNLLETCLLKVETNLSTLPFAVTNLDTSMRNELRGISDRFVVHATLHAKPATRQWKEIKAGLALAIDLGMDVYPAIGGDWSVEDMEWLAGDLESIASGLIHRLAVRPFRMAYAERHGRGSLPVDQLTTLSASTVWEQILRDRTGVAYLHRPRHLVRIS